MVKIVSSSERAGTIELKGLVPLTSRQRTFLAMQWGGLCFVAACVSVLVPVMHFFLVPMFLIFTPIAAWRGFYKEYACAPQTIPCPDCQKLVAIDNKYVQMPIKVNCLECGARLTIYPP